jgi:hypothetical protein
MVPPVPVFHLVAGAQASDFLRMLTLVIADLRRSFFSIVVPGGSGFVKRMLAVHFDRLEDFLAFFGRDTSARQAEFSDFERRPAAPMRIVGSAPYR